VGYSRSNALLKQSYITLEQVDTMFGSLVIRYREKFADVVDDGSWWRHLKLLYTKISQLRTAGPLPTSSMPHSRSGT
jgi:hypothetical protein